MSDKKEPKEALKTFENIMKASVKGNPKPKSKVRKQSKIDRDIEK